MQQVLALLTERTMPIAMFMPALLYLPRVFDSFTFSYRIITRG